MPTIAILGAGNGGFAAAAHLATEGHRPQLYNRSAGTIAAIKKRGGIRHSGVLGEGTASVPVITTDLSRALDGSDLLMICLPATALDGIAGTLADHLGGSRPLLVNPGATGGALAVRETLREAGCASVPPIAETNTLTYIARKQSDEHVRVSSLVDNVRCAAVPPATPEEAIEPFLELYPTLTPVSSPLHTALSNVNAVLHPPGIVLSAAWIEHTGGDFRFYFDAGTPAVASVMEDLEEERLAIADAVGLAVDPFPEMFADIGSTSEAAAESGSFLRMLRESEPNKSIMAPDSVDHRYFNEDIPFGLVPMAALGRWAGVETPVIDSLVTIASSINGTEYRERGWTLADLGIPADAEPGGDALS
ncbi:MAG: NAD/NADP octopine/nopaline dehydrogenase family protein [Halobacteriales archaeon]